ncbi:hypothetical protein EXIGLDRAFT_697846 [Exidia glandulosa HHB12029]|uniref:F-box domain-containing protein n=1 Tax=Exidia glandulosa HHB12029 TaxID=1314781 RepID=A0A165ZZG1_EXIGL|nr:hypothetical protein EXIGLDRAFT_697846 [Exidia glandulosa HHB12029]
MYNGPLGPKRLLASSLLPFTLPAQRTSLAMAKRKSKAKVYVQREESPEEATGPRRASLPVPDSVILDICDFAHPRDVLHLSRTCETLHAVLTSRASASAWKQAFRNVEMPDPPDDLAGHRYAALAFEAICDNCYKRCNKKNATHWAVRLRLCRNCIAKALVPLPVSICGLPKAQVAQIVPTSTMAGYSHGMTSPAALRAVTSEVESVVRDPVALAAYLQTVQGRTVAMRGHADAVEHWDEKAVLSAQKYEALETRREEICSRLEREGWSRQLERTRRFIVEHPLVTRPRKLFDDDWADTKATLIADATAWYTAQQSNKRNKLQKIHRYRRWVMASWISDTMKAEADDDGVWPDPNDLRTMPELQYILNGEFDSDVEYQREEPSVQSPNDRSAGAERLPTRSGQDDDSISSEDARRDDDDDICDSDDDLLQAYDELSVNESFLALSETVSDPICADLDEETEGPLAQQRHRWMHHRRSGEGCAWCTNQKRYVRKAVELRLPAAIVAWRRRIAAEVFDLVPVSLLRDAGIDPNSLDDNAKEAFLSRATIIFCCSTNHELNWDYLVCGANSDDSRLASFPYVLHHRDICIIEDRWKKIQEDPDESYVDPREQLFVAWSAEKLSFDEEAHDLAVNLVTQCGLDPSVATHADMERVDGRFVCHTTLNDLKAKTNWKATTNVKAMTLQKTTISLKTMA